MKLGDHHVVFGKSAWVLAAVTLVVGAYYIIGLSTGGGIAAPGQLLPAIIIFIVLVAITHIVIAVINPKNADVTDERDRDIERKAEMAGGYTLGGFVLFILAFAALDGQWHIANVAFIGLLASELVKSLWQVVLHRRAA